MKSYTDLEQSKKLTEILPIESADMYYPVMEDNIPCKRAYPKDEEYLPGEDIECWSLATLLDNIPQAKLDSTKQYDKKLWSCYAYFASDWHDSDWYDNPVDACYEMIIKSHELNLL